MTAGTIELDGREWATTRAAADLLGITTETARNWAQSGRFDTAGRRAWIRLGDRYRVDLAAVRAYVRKQAR